MSAFEDPLRWTLVVAAMFLAVGSGAAVVLAFGRPGVRVWKCPLFAGVALYGVTSVGQQLRNFGGPYTWLTWTLAGAMTCSLIGVGLYLRARWPDPHMTPGALPARRRTGGT